MASLDEPPFLPGPLDPALAQRRADQATAKFLPELLNSREFRERFEIRRRPTACARFTSGLLWALAGAAVLLLTALAFPQLLLLGGDVGRALSSRSVSSGTPAHSSWPAAPQQLQQHLHQPHPQQHPQQQLHGPVPEHQLLGEQGAATQPAAATAAILPSAAAGPSLAARSTPDASAGHDAQRRVTVLRFEEQEQRPSAAVPPAPATKPIPAPPPTPTAGAAPSLPRPAPSTPGPLQRVVQLLPPKPAHSSSTAPSTPKLAAPPPQLPPPPAPSTSSPLSAVSVDLTFRCRQWAALVQQHDGAPRTPGADAPAWHGATQPEPGQPRAPAVLLAALAVVSGLLVLALALLGAIVVRLATPLADCLSGALPGTDPGTAPANPDAPRSPATTGATAASTLSYLRATTATPTRTLPSPVKLLPTSDAHIGASPSPVSQQAEAAAAPSPAESASASGGTWSSCSGAGRDGGEHGATASAEATSATQPAAKTKANEETSEQASDISTWAQVETPSRAPSFRDQLPSLPEDLAGWVAVSVPSAAGDEPHSGAPRPQAAAPQTVAPPPHRQQEPSTPPAIAAISGSTVAAGGCSRLPSVLRPLATYGSTPIVQAPAAAATATSAAPGAVSDEVSPPLDATLPAAPWPFAYPDSVERARLTATPTASTTSTGGSEGVHAAAAAAAAAALTPAVWSGTVAPLAVDVCGAEDSDHPIFDLSRYDSNGDELHASALPSAAAMPPSAAAAQPPQAAGLSRLPRLAMALASQNRVAAMTPAQGHSTLSVVPAPIEEGSATRGGDSADADGGAGRPPPHHRWRMAKKAVALKLHAARRAATDTSAHRDSRADGSVSGSGSASGGSGGALASGAAVNAALAAAADAADQHAAETPRLTTFPEERPLRGPSLTLQPMEAAEMVTPVWPPQRARQARHADTAAAAVPDAAAGEGGAAYQGGGGDGNEDNGQEAESSGRFAAEALSLADCLSAARGCNAGGATVTAAAAATDADGEAGLLGGWSACAAGEPADLFKGRPAAAAYSPGISVLRPPAPPATAAPGCAAEPSREHAAAAAAAVATLQSLKHSARRLVEATRAGSYWRPQDGPDGVTGCDGDQDVRMAQTELHAAAAQLKQLRLTGPSSSGTAPAAPAPARKALAFTPAATPFGAVESSGPGPFAGAAGRGVRRSSDSWASIGSCVVPQLVGEAASGGDGANGAAAVSDSFLITPAPRAPPVAPQPIRRSKIPLLTPASDLASSAATTPATSSMSHLHLGTPAVVGNNLSETPMAAAGAAQSFATSSSSGTSGDSAAGGLSSILAGVAQAAAIKAMQAGLICPDLVSPPGTTSSASGGVRSGLPRLVPWPVLTASQSQQSRPPAPAPTPASSGAAAAAAPGKLCATSRRSSSALEDAVQDLDSGDGGGGPCSNRSSSNGSDGATDFNKENCQPPAEESPYSHSGASPDSGASPCSFRLAGRELPSDAEVQAFLAATALSRSPASDAAAPGASPPPPVSPLDSLLRVLPSAVEVLVVQLCALADLAAERQREVLAWHATAAAQAMLMREAEKETTAPTGTSAISHGAATTTCQPVSQFGGAATCDQEHEGGAAEAEHSSPARESMRVETAQSAQIAKQTRPADELVATGGDAAPGADPRAAAQPDAAAASELSPGAMAGLSPVARCDSAEGRALMALIGRMVGELEMEEGLQAAHADAAALDLLVTDASIKQRQGGLAPPPPPLKLALVQQQEERRDAREVEEGPLYEVPLDGGSLARAAGSSGPLHELTGAVPPPPVGVNRSIGAAAAEEAGGSSSEDAAVALSGDSDGSEAPATAEGADGDAEYVVVYGLVESMRTPRTRRNGSRTSSMATTPVVPGAPEDSAGSACVSATGLVAGDVDAAGAQQQQHAGGLAAWSAAASAPPDAWAPCWSPWPSAELPAAPRVDTGGEMSAAESTKTKHRESGSALPGGCGRESAGGV
ncbi:hypothetical protein HYH02_006036 [Chlamydomonas schloesseri]|uniref:Uncharacterized protein n=1 Tax=Chlamydomonas schloesseri TaxID=2026947 RepID=A0A835WJ74_9CHLO|nr:hypothetical protein HYH02_006036 [Chlamydomonas schloesseri]|eukprot:KAG2448679.1 hypothetical protein HYH02_006036 [Chlamydomonas schloesseri]